MNFLLSYLFSPCIFIIGFILALGNKKCRLKSAMRALVCIPTLKRHRKKYSLKWLHFTCIYASIRKISTTKKPTFMDVFTTFLLPAYLKRTEYIDRMSSFNSLNFMSFYHK
ncbi:hypothetical protein CKR_2229 [Clostridium kluyveri NBRC 12016]|uniref:Uncharacterized protein n=1 Tax=Clostridium kluyveri (strain NBRC 12016) TaxID=583346 RepID=B9E455_CLOK1|nr:hypothetical protein CKR_2229 [Clostridium kluyveri NBRC 12016]